MEVVEACSVKGECGEEDRRWRRAVWMPRGGAGEGHTEAIRRPRGGPAEAACGGEGAGECWRDCRRRKAGGPAGSPGQPVPHGCGCSVGGFPKTPGSGVTTHHASPATLSPVPRTEGSCEPTAKIDGRACDKYMSVINICRYTSSMISMDTSDVIGCGSLVR
jgi:hypothetical protein